MKRITLILISIISLATIKAGVSDEAFKRWHGNKYSMFIHFGLYSELGGVWNGEPVKKGYSEQIQSFAGIFSDWYADTALKFNPEKFNADSIVSLAKEAGMKSIVFTTKHHDGFCMFNTSTTDYNSYDATPCKRDFIKEMSEACKRGNMNFGLYFSIIDWNYPHAYPISSHNCDFITPQHHELSKKQVTELLTKYGPISEIWFDMGSNTPEQSKELYDLVHKLQPDCMVSGRVGNDFYDFSVMADNAYPESALQCPWQSAASMFNETWSYRSWQVRGSVHEKAMEKLRSLINVVSHGGNFLLNIGPKGDGSVVPFEKDVLLEIGAWLKKNGNAIYGTEASPFRTQFDWGMITRKGKNMYLILSGKYPKNGKINLHMPNYELVKGDGKLATCIQKNGTVEITIPASAYKDKTIHVLTLEFTTDIKEQNNEPVKSIMLTAENATPNYSYSCFDYYSNYRSTVSYSWNFEQLMLKQLELIYTEKEVGKTLDVNLDGKEYKVTLNDGKPSMLSVASGTVWGKQYICGPGSSLFDAPSTINTDLDNPPVKKGEWKETDEGKNSIPGNILETYFVMQNVESPKEQYVIIEAGAGNGIEIYLNGKSVMKHLNPYRCKFKSEKVLLNLKKGNNQIVMRVYNRFEKNIEFLLQPSEDQTIYRQDITLPEMLNGKYHQLNVRQNGLPSIHSDTELSNLRIRLRRIAL